jgi:superoxide dismutase
LQTVFGSGWAWLIFNSATGKVEVAATSNQDSPAMTPGKHLLLGLDGACGCRRTEMLPSMPRG